MRAVGRWKAGPIRKSRRRNWRQGHTPIRAVDIADRAAVREAGGKFDRGHPLREFRRRRGESYRRGISARSAKFDRGITSARVLFSRAAPPFTPRTAANGSTRRAPRSRRTRPARFCGRLRNSLGKTAVSIARLAGIYGPGRSALLRKFLSGEARIEGDGARILNQVHRDDIAAALLLLAGLPNENGIFNVVDDEPITQRETYTWLAARLDQPLPPSADRPTRRKRGASNKRVSNAKLRSLGWKPRFPNFASGMESLLSSP